MTLKGIDISFWKDKQDYTKAKGIDFVIMGVTQRYGIDECFEHNYESCRKAGLKIGAYKFSYAVSPEDSKLEAEEVVKVLNGRPLDFPIFIDLEWDVQEGFTDNVIRGIITQFEKVVVGAGYRFGIYCNMNWFNNIIPDDFKKKYDFWIARVPTKDKGQYEESLKPDIGSASLVGWQYSWFGHVDGIIGPVFDMDEFYTDFTSEDKEKVEETAISADDIIRRAKKWIGLNGYTGTNKKLFDIYNKHKPLAQGYKVKYTDDWCDIFVSAVFIKCDATDLLGGTECGVQRHVELFKSIGIWTEDRNRKPNRGDIIVYDWDNNAFADHIGIVYKVKGDGTIVSIEGNVDNTVKYCYHRVGDGSIKGYAMPRYASNKEETKTIHEIALEVINGEWGNGETRRQRLTDAGYDYEKVQFEVNYILEENTLG